ncbi:hypothetical protein HPP92_002483 [Vanilla planifolia]|uniref:Pentatricopeptide repeat-containing protein n=1 Tax=Vanilla planifolia TaxID=51239 RepID=A0A835S6E5_VANPL|nr:hypothetical protein HPP92_002483 [Vanilla planifolia]
MHVQRFFSSYGHGYRFLDSFDYVRLLHSSTGLRSLKRIHAQVLTAGLHQNPFLAAKLVSCYAEVGAYSMPDARKVFDLSFQRDIVLYNVIIRGYAYYGHVAEAVAVFTQLVSSWALRPNLYTYSFVLKACAAAGRQNIGRAVHGYAVRAGAGLDLFVGNALIVLYAKCGCMETARLLFDVLPRRDLVTWNSMISGYSQNGCYCEALVILHRMPAENMPDYVTLVSVLPACTALAAIRDGMWVHAYALKSGYGVDAAVGSGLVEMYASCGHFNVARQVFDRIIEKNIVVYNSMMTALGAHGNASAALELFTKMLAAGIKPDAICFVSILSACSHAGLVTEAIEIFEKMDALYGVQKGQLHYACMVDLLGRAGN